MIKELKGYHVLAIAVAAFAIVIGANLAMLFAATGSFPGLVVKNSYVASQQWNEKAAAQAALGWRAGVGYAGGVVTVRLTDAAGAPVRGADLRLTIGRPTQDRDDRVLAAPDAGGLYRVPVALAPGRWQIKVATASGPAFARTALIEVGR